MTGKGSDIVGFTFLLHTGHLLHRQSHWRETNAGIKFCPEGFWSAGQGILIWQCWGGVLAPRPGPLSRSTLILTPHRAFTVRLMRQPSFPSLSQKAPASPQTKPFSISSPVRWWHAQHYYEQTMQPQCLQGKAGSSASVKPGTPPFPVLVPVGATESIKVPSCFS